MKLKKLMKLYVANRKEKNGLLDSKSNMKQNLYQHKMVYYMIWHIVKMDKKNQK